MCSGGRSAGMCVHGRRAPASAGPRTLVPRVKIVGVRLTPPLQRQRVPETLPLFSDSPCGVLLTSGWHAGFCLEAQALAGRASRNPGSQR